MCALLHQVALVSDTPTVKFSEVAAAAAALQKQATRDFAPLWNVRATVSAFDSLESIPVDYWPVIIAANINQPGAAGYHTDDQGQPFSLVQAGDQWQLTASHETLEMLADPFGNRTIAGAPPPQAPKPLSELPRVTYLMEVCDPCEDMQFAYTVNGQHVSDFITPHYYDPNGAAAGTLYSFRGHIKGPHTVLDNGYVSFGNPATKDWYQIVVTGGQTEAVNLGKLNTSGKSLREAIDEKVRDRRNAGAPRESAPAAETSHAPGEAVGAPAGNALAESNAARAKLLRDYIERLSGKDKAA